MYVYTKPGKNFIANVPLSIINITLHETIRPKVLDKGVIPKLIDVLKDSNIEDMDLSKVSANALHNMAVERNYWNIE